MLFTGYRLQCNCYKHSVFLKVISPSDPTHVLLKWWIGLVSINNLGVLSLFYSF